MTKRIKWAMLALLGFSTACSTVKNSAKEPQKETPEELAPRAEEHRIRVLYGVRRPEVQPVDSLDGEQTPASSVSNDEK